MSYRGDDIRRDDRSITTGRSRDHHMDEIQEKRGYIDRINQKTFHHLNKLEYNPSQASTNSKSPEYYNDTLEYLSKPEFISKKVELDTFINEKFADKKDRGGCVLIDGENLFYKLGHNIKNFSIIEKILSDESNSEIHETLQGFTNCIIFIQNHRDRAVVEEISRIFGKYFTKNNIKIIETQSKTEIDDIFLIYSLVEILKKNTPCIILSSDNFTWFRFNREIPNSTNIHIMISRGPQINIFRNSFKLDITEFLPDHVAYGPGLRSCDYARGKLTLRAKRKRRRNTQTQTAKPNRRTNTQTQRAKPKRPRNTQTQRAKSKKDKKNKN